jgi:hypothetical protein
MSERFSDEVLRRAWDAACVAWTTAEVPGDPSPEDKAVAAMRAVLEGHLAEQERPCDSADCQLSGPHTLTEVCYPADHPDTVRILGEPARDYPMALECPCCGDTGATGDSAGMFYDGQPLECGCLGHVSVDEEEAHVLLLDDSCPPNAKCRKPSTGPASDWSPR